MLCDNYKDALIEAAASGAALASAVSEHLNLCASCRGIFSAQQSLFELVDAGLHSRANVTVPANFDHRVRAALQIAGSKDRKRYSPLVASGSLAVAAALLMAILLTQNVKHGGKETAGNSLVEGKIAGSPHPPVVSGDAMSLRRSSPRALHSRGNAWKTSQPLETPVELDANTQVLVPEGQEEALAKYMEGLAVQRTRIGLSASLQHEPELRPIEVPSIQVSQITVNPLPDLSAD